MKTRQRHQTGCVQQRIRAGAKVWVGIYRDAEGKQCITEPLDAKTKSQAQSRLAEFLIPINAARTAKFSDLKTTLAAYVEHVYIPWGQRKWKGSTAMDSIQRARLHLINGGLGSIPVSKLDRETMQEFLDRYATRSKSLVNHLRFDLQAILRLAVADGLASGNQAEALYTPRTCTQNERPVMTAEQVSNALQVLDVRERAFVRLAVYAGMRPGEIIALKWSDVNEDGTVLVDDRIYRGTTDVTKNGKARVASLSPSIVKDLKLWRQFALPGEYIFSSENGTALWYQNLWRRDIQPRFDRIGLGWADFRCMRRTNATLMKVAGTDVKVAADQRGHNVGVSIDEYTQSTRQQKSDAINRLEALIQ